MGRFFAGVKLPVAMEEKLVELERLLQPHVPVKRWYGIEQFHITTNFLGELDAAGLAAAIRCLEQVVPGQPPFHLTLKGIGAFPDARVIWCGVGGETDRLASLQNQLRQGFRPLGAERYAKPAFVPHITLARTGDLRSFRADCVDAEPLLQGAGWTVDRICLFESVMHPAGARYPVVHEVLLGSFLHEATGL
ncbi:RNA 2',3'-cyclic phosphodiesterase [Effusibacillus pohliae]|uniref:RNA 2',3'-cyclic phosphodiesterase n=1 Tax=Effusibacillus pohliae TaxID=232270 RepID=UPI00035FA96D|nr:RNA 2',3'-cyclic phosphodiesterase [Effusibacillus pohliae]